MKYTFALETCEDETDRVLHSSEVSADAASKSDARMALYSLYVAPGEHHPFLHQRLRFIKEEQ